MTMKSDKRPVIGLICVMLSCILVIGITIGLLGTIAGNEPGYEILCDTDIKYRLMGTDKVVLSPAWEY